MALPDWTLATWPQFADYLRADVGKIAELTFAEAILSRATTLIEGALRRRLVFRGSSAQWAAGEGYTEYHTVDRDGLWYLFTEEAPINAVSLLAEDTTGQFSPGDVLVEGDDFRAQKTEGRLVRVVGGGTSPSGFTTGVDIVKVIYSAGYLSTPSRGNVPADLAEACLEVAGLLWREADRRAQGLRSQSSGAPGAVATTRFDPLKLPPHVEQIIAPYRRVHYNPTFRRG